MDKTRAIKTIRETFENPFDKGRFTYFIKELFNSIDDSSFTYAGNYIPDAYKPYIASLERVGKYSDTEDHKIDILIAQLKKQSSLEHARTMQRNFIGWYLNGSRGGVEKDAAIVAFVSPDPGEWRFSLVKMEYDRDTSGKAKRELTPARRWSFLVGEAENSHTAQKQLLPILQDEHNSLLSQLENAFNIEVVTREFFEKYRDLFHQVRDELEKIVQGSEAVKVDFEAKAVNTVDFSKKLLGQIVFLYFLQKKGWFGVGRDAEWGTGPKNFLRELFEKKHAPYQNFFNDILEPLFYEALARERDNDFYSRFNCKIPFLNGGLFDPINGYDWVHTDIILPDELFSNDYKTKEGDTGTGILDVFDRYNFTVKEDEPLEKEVAVDPEMLGKVFENLLEVKDRKSKGTYYTPREIVHYMCQESLINYLDNAINTQEKPIIPPKPLQKKLFSKDTPVQTSLTIEKYEPVIPRPHIEFLIRHGDIAVDNDLAKEQGTKSYHYKMEESIRKNAGLIDRKLAEIKICDPAVGSGAFPVGMMHEIVRARYALTPYIGIGDERSPYNFKRHAIQESIYGVDIDSGAVDIAKLRLWLSLVVDEEDIKQIKPLPNLDYKVVCGNSLLGIEPGLLNYHLFEELEKIKQQFFDETSPRKKKEEKDKIDRLIKQITNNDEHFSYKAYFSEVFLHKSSGFDAVIANPPYVRQETIKPFKAQLKEDFRDFYCGTADLYTYFYKRGLDLLKPGGCLCFIAPNKFMRAAYGKNTRNLLTTQATPKVVIDFGDLPIFEATTYPSILLLEKRRPDGKDKTLAATFSEEAQIEQPEKTLAGIGFTMPITTLKSEGWNLEQPEVLALMEKLRSIGKPLGEYVQGRFYRGVVTGFNEAFVIDAATRERLISENPASAEIIKPWLRGRDIHKWKAEWAGLYVIFTRRGIDIELYPAVKRYLEQFREDLEPKESEDQKRGRKPGPYKWFEIQDNIAYFEEFDQPKIIYPNITKTNIFAFDSSGIFTNQKCFIIPTDDLYLLAVLNSKLNTRWSFSTLPLLRGGFFEPSSVFMQHFPVFPASDTQKAPIIEHVQAILADPAGQDVPKLEAEINRLIYALYGLTPDEIAIIEGKR